MNKRPIIAQAATRRHGVESAELTYVLRLHYCSGRSLFVSSRGRLVADAVGHAGELADRVGRRRLRLAWTNSGVLQIQWSTVIALFILAIVGEIVEFLAGVVGARRAGGSSRAAIYSLIGSFVGALGGATVGFRFPSWARRSER